MSSSPGDKFAPFFRRPLTRWVRPGASGRARPVGPLKEAAGFKVHYGASLTVGMASGDTQTADARFRRHGALAENMEGSAIAQTCLLFDVPFLEFRGISNMAGVRDKAKWDIGAALDHCTAVIKLLLDTTAFLKPAVFNPAHTFRKFDFSSRC